MSSNLQHFSLPDITLSCPISDQLLRTDESLVRLDERARLSGLCEPWAGRLLYRNTCAGVQNCGGLVHLEDLVLLDGHAFRGAMYADLSDGLHTLKLWQRALGAAPARLLQAPMPGEEVRPLMSEAGADQSQQRPDVFYEADFDQAERVGKWREVWRSCDSLPPLLAAAVVWDAWHIFGPDAQGPWRASLLAALVLRARGKVRDWMVPIDSGTRIARSGWSAMADQTSRLSTFLSMVAAAVKSASNELDGLVSARERMTLKIRAVSKASRLPELRDLLIAKPLVSIPLAAKALGISKQAIRVMLPQLGSTPREITDRRRYRCWTVP